MEVEGINDDGADYLDCLTNLIDDTANVSTADEPIPQTCRPHQSLSYNGHKPKWWKNLCGKATKSQKRAMTEILRDYQLPRTPYGSFLNWKEIFPACSEIWLELGFGRGENLLALAHRKSRNTAFVGAEIHQPGVGTICQRMQEAIRESIYWSDYVAYSAVLDPHHHDSTTTTDAPIANDDFRDMQGDAYSNVRIYVGDGVKLLPYISSSSLTAVLVTFPDPFPREQQKQWRLIQTATIVEMHRILKTGGRLFLATDHEGYHDWTHSVINILNQEKTRFILVDPCPDRVEWLPAISRYEHKGWDEGRITRLSCWQAFRDEETNLILA